MRCSLFRNISLLVPDVGTSDRLQVQGLGRVAQDTSSIESERWPRLLVSVSAIDSRGTHVNVVGGLRLEFARIGVSFEGRQTDRQVWNARSKRLRYT